MPTLPNYAVEMLNITKIFNETIVANNNISIRVKKGEIHAIVGENGAGKSTLMSILFGLYQPTKGSIKINGQIVAINGSIKANQLGIGMVHQHFKLVDNFTILQNIILGSEPVHRWQWLNYHVAKQKIKAISAKYHLNIPLNLKIENASVGIQQRVEILKVLYRGADIIVLDEPTAVLTPQEITSLLGIIQDLKAAGKTIIFISHKLSEVKAIADSITVIRNGNVIDSFAAADKTKAEIAILMVGRELVKVKNQGNTNLGATVLKMENVTVKRINAITNTINFKAKLQNIWDVLSQKRKTKSQQHSKLSNSQPKMTVKTSSKKSANTLTERYGLEKFNLEIKAGEIVAIAGVEGNGQQELIYSLTGLTKTAAGNIWFQSKNITNSSVNKLYKMGLSHIPEDRHKYALVLDYNVIDNMVLQNINSYPYSRYGLLRKKAIQSYAQKIINEYDVRGSDSGFAIIRGLSGGNQQKAVVGRELKRQHKLLVVAQPTRGLDIGAIEYIHKMILNEKAKGNAVLLISYELGEVLTLADRIVVLHSGRITGDVAAKSIQRETLGLMMAGQKWEEINQNSPKKGTNNARKI